MTVTPMLAKDTRGDTSMVPSSWVMEPKLDGWRWIATVEDTGVVSVGGRNGAVHASPPCVEQLIDLPTGTVLDGELVPLDRSEKSPMVNHYLAHGGEGLAYVVFDCLQAGGVDLRNLPWSERRHWLESLLTGLVTHDLMITPYVPCDDVDAQVKAWVDAGFEGAVCKSKGSIYREGKRSSEWLKVKPQTVMDATVIGWEWGKGASNRALVGALQIRLPHGAETTCAWKGTPAEGDAMVGREIEVRHHGQMKSGLLRHPIFHRTREDLEPVVKPKGPVKPRQTRPVLHADGGSKRNYAAMGLDNLERAVQELRAESGDAYNRVIALGGDPDMDLARAQVCLTRKHGQVAA